MCALLSSAFSGYVSGRCQAKEGYDAPVAKGHPLYH
jgi:hypothetical protein